MEQCGRERGVTGPLRAATFHDKPRKGFGIYRHAIHPERVPRRTGLESVADCTPQVRDIDLKQLSGGRRCGGRPQRVDQHVRRQLPPLGQRKDREQRTLFERPDADLESGFSTSNPHPHRTEHVDRNSRHRDVHDDATNHVRTVPCFRRSGPVLAWVSPLRCISASVQKFVQRRRYSNAMSAAREAAAAQGAVAERVDIRQAGRPGCRFGLRIACIGSERIAVGPIPS